MYLCTYSAPVNALSLWPYTVTLLENPAPIYYPSFTLWASIIGPSSTSLQQTTPVKVSRGQHMAKLDGFNSENSWSHVPPQTLHLAFKTSVSLDSPHTCIAASLLVSLFPLTCKHWKARTYASDFSSVSTLTL